MTEQELILEAEEIGTELVPARHGTVFHTDDPLEVIQQATRIAAPLADLVRKQKLTSNISGKEHVRVEGWTLLGSMLGVYPVCEWTRETANGWEARVEARTMSGQVVGAAEAQCDRSESTWKNRDGYALRSMAQTRATSKALRQPLGFVMQLAGFDPTPAEEMPRDGGVREERRQENTGAVKVPTSWAKITELVSLWDAFVHDTFGEFVNALVRYEFDGAETPKDLRDKASKDWLFQKCAGAAVALREAFDPNVPPPPGLEDIRAAFAQVVGVELAIVSEGLDEEAAQAAEREA